MSAGNVKHRPGLVIAGVTIALAILVGGQAGAADDPRPKLSFASPVEAGCFLASDGSCVIHVDPFTAVVAAGERLMRFQLQANGQVIYDFTTDSSNPPVGNYSPGLDRLEFAAVCEVSYSVSALTQDTGDPGLVVAGASETFTCPAPTPIPVELMQLIVE
jgi:hypothetical protein